MCGGGRGTAFTIDELNITQLWDKMMDGSEWEEIEEYRGVEDDRSDVCTECVCVCAVCVCVSCLSSCRTNSCKAVLIRCVVDTTSLFAVWDVDGAGTRLH